MTLEDIKKTFYKYDGSLFSIAREERDVYECYQMLNISEEILEKWRLEMILDLFEQLKVEGSSELFNRMYNISESSRNRNNLFILEQALQFIKYKSQKENAFVSEIILGRKDLVERSGMVFWAYDLGEQGMAEKLLKYVHGLLSVEVCEEKINQRFERLKKKWNLISLEIVCAK